MNSDRTLPWDWYPGKIPQNVALDETAYLETSYSFLLFRSLLATAVKVGHGTSIYLGTMFDVGPQGSVTFGDYVLMNGARIICDSQVTIGNHCLVSWNVVLMDTYRLSLAPEQRRRELESAAVRSPRSAAANVSAQPIHIANNVWIGFDV